MTGKKHDVWQSTEYFNELVKVDKSDEKKNYPQVMEQELEILMDFKIIEKTMCCYCQINHGQTYTTSLLICQVLGAFNFFVCSHVQDVFYYSFQKK